MANPFNNKSIKNTINASTGEVIKEYSDDDVNLFRNQLGDIVSQEICNSKGLSFKELMRSYSLLRRVYYDPLKAVINSKIDVADDVRDAIELETGKPIAESIDRARRLLERILSDGLVMMYESKENVNVLAYGLAQTKGIVRRTGNRDEEYQLLFLTDGQEDVFINNEYFVVRGIPRPSRQAIEHAIEYSIINAAIPSLALKSNQKYIKVDKFDNFKAMLRFNKSTKQDDALKDSFKTTVLANADPLVLTVSIDALDRSRDIVLDNMAIETGYPKALLKQDDTSKGLVFNSSEKTPAILAMQRFYADKIDGFVKPFLISYFKVVAKISIDFDDIIIANIVSLNELDKANVIEARVNAIQEIREAFEALDVSTIKSDIREKLKEQLENIVDLM